MRGVRWTADAVADYVGKRLKPVPALLAPPPAEPDRFMLMLRAAGVPAPIPEYRFAPPRRWRADYAWPGILIVEIDGGVWTQGRHTRGAGFLADLSKLNAAALLGYRVLRYTPQQLNLAVHEIAQLLGGTPWHDPGKSSAASPPRRATANPPSPRTSKPG